MKNIFILPTQKASNLTIRSKTNELMYSYKQFSPNNGDDVNINQNIYITNNEEGKRGDWILNIITEEIIKSDGFIEAKDWRKIILTTDQYLNKDGIQALDDTFLERFVSNPVDYVEVEKDSKWESTVYDQPDVLVSFYSVSFPAEKELGKDFKFTIDDEGMCTEMPINKEETLEEAKKFALSHIKETVKKYPRGGHLTNETLQYLMEISVEVGYKFAVKEIKREQTFTKEDLQEAFKAGISFEHGEQESWKTYNKFTGNQQPNKELNFEEWFKNKQL